MSGEDWANSSSLGLQWKRKGNMCNSLYFWTKRNHESCKDLLECNSFSSKNWWQGKIREGRGFPFGFPCHMKDVLTLYIEIGDFFCCLFLAVASSCWQAACLGTKHTFQIGNCSVAWRSFSTSKNYIPFPVIKTQLRSWTKRSCCCWIPCSFSHPREDFAGF